VLELYWVAVDIPDNPNDQGKLLGFTQKLNDRASVRFRKLAKDLIQSMLAKAELKKRGPANERTHRLIREAGRWALAKSTMLSEI